MDAFMVEVVIIIAESGGGGDVAKFTFSIFVFKGKKTNFFVSFFSSSVSSIAMGRR